MSSVMKGFIVGALVGVPFLLIALVGIKEEREKSNKSWRCPDGQVLLSLTPSNGGPVCVVGSRAEFR